MKLLQFLTDGNDRLSHARLLNVLVGVVACVLSGILVWQGKYSEYYFGLLLVYGAGQQTINKLLDTVGARFGVRHGGSDEGIRTLPAHGARSPRRATDGRRDGDGPPGEDTRDTWDGAGAKAP